MHEGFCGWKTRRRKHLRRLRGRLKVNIKIVLKNRIGGCGLEITES